MKNRTLVVMFITAILVLVGCSSPAASNAVSQGTQSVMTASLPGLLTSQEVWPANNDNQLKARLDAIGLPALSSEGTVMHTHEHIDIFLHGNKASVPPMIGIDPQEKFISPIHVHDATSTIHIESPTVEKFTLGQFFDVWGVQFTNTCIGGYCTDSTNKLQVHVNGKLIDSGYRDIELVEHQEIVVTYGTDKELPNPVPSTFDFGTQGL